MLVVLLGIVAPVVLASFLVPAYSGQRQRKEEDGAGSREAVEIVRSTVSTGTGGMRIAGRLHNGLPYAITAIRMSLSCLTAGGEKKEFPFVAGYRPPRVETAYQPVAAGGDLEFDYFVAAQHQEAARCTIEVRGWSRHVDVFK